MSHLLRRAAIAILPAALLMALAMCAEPGPTQPGEAGVSGSQLTFLHFASETPSSEDGGLSASISRSTSSGGALLTSDTSFVATHGEATSVELFYADSDGTGPGDRFLHFELDENSLASYPSDHPRAGAAFAPGDTVTITISASADTLVAKFRPGGLQFDPDAPAELEVSYSGAEFDLESEEEIDLWKQENAGAPWFRVGELQDLELDVIEATLTSFTRYAMAI